MPTSVADPCTCHRHVRRHARDHPQGDRHGSQIQCMGSVSSPSKAFDYAGDKLKSSWAALHAGDCEPFPDAKRATALLKAVAKPPKGTRCGQALRDLAGSLARLPSRRFPRGLHPRRIARAARRLGRDQGDRHPCDLSRQGRRRETQALRKGVEIADKAVATLPDEANSHYRKAFALGRYSQGISIGKALTMGLAGKVKAALDATIGLSPKHAEAHISLGGLPRRDHQQGRRDDRRPDLRREGRTWPIRTSRPRSSSPRIRRSRMSSTRTSCCS